LAGIYYKDDLIKTSLRLVEGAVQVPDGPGMGVDIDEEKIMKYRVGDDA